jgi:hypothetical protein
VAKSSRIDNWQICASTATDSLFFFVDYITHHFRAWSISAWYLSL